MTSRNSKFFILSCAILLTVISIFELGLYLWPSVTSVSLVNTSLVIKPDPLVIDEAPNDKFRLRRKHWPSKVSPSFCLEETLSEDGLIDIIQKWNSRSTDDTQKQRVAGAIFKLGEMKSVKAIRTLVRNILFQYAESASEWSHYNDSNDAPPFSSYALSFAALRKIGPIVAHSIIERLVELDEDSNAAEVFYLRQVLLGVLPREKAAALVREKATGINEIIIRLRLEKSASLFDTSFAIAN